MKKRGESDEKKYLCLEGRDFFALTSRPRRLILTWKLFLSAVVRDGQEIGPAGLRAERAGTKATNTPKEYRGRRVTESPRQTRAICFAITGNPVDFAPCYYNQRGCEHAQREQLNRCLRRSRANVSPIR